MSKAKKQRNKTQKAALHHIFESFKSLQQRTLLASSCAGLVLENELTVVCLLVGIGDSMPGCATKALKHSTIVII